MFYSSIFGHPQFLILAMPMLDRHLVYALTVSLELVITIHLIRIFTARRYAQARSLLSSCVSVRPSVCPSGWWSSNFLFDPVAPSSLFYPKCQCLIQRETPSAGAQKYTGVGKFSDFRLKWPFISETVRDRPLVVMER